MKTDYTAANYWSALFRSDRESRTASEVLLDILSRV
jgi:hypothetical protein